MWRLRGSICRRRLPRGITLIEAVVAIGLLVGFSLAIYGIVIQLSRATARAGERVASLGIAQEQLEIIRNLAYDNVGTVGGVPAGVLEASRMVSRNNRTFTVTTIIRNIDDPFDGTIGGTPNDIAPADYKLVEVNVNCVGCSALSAVKLTTTVAPNGLEIGTNNGALFIKAINAFGQPVAGATVTVINSAVSPAINLTDTTNINGELQLIDVPPSVTTYQITVTKDGYSTDATLAVSGSNPNPTKPFATVAVGQVTQVTFAIDTLANLNVTTVNTFCSPLSYVTYRLEGAKVIGSNPTVLKYSEDLDSGASGILSQTLEWDTYSMTLTDSRYDLVGTVGTLPANLLPSGTQNISLILGSPTANGLHVTVKDSATQLPLSDASVRAQFSGYDQTLVTGRGYLLQTDWSGGGGQAAFLDETRYESDDGQADVASTVGQVMLKQTAGVYASTATLTSSTFDTGGATNFVTVGWAPVSQPLEVGNESVRFQIATNNDNATWDYLGPDGTSATYYTVSNISVHEVHNDSRYLRYRLYLTTADTAATPIVSDVSISFTSSCIPPGQVFFSGLSAGTYAVSTSAAGYDSDLQNALVNDWTSLTVLLTEN